MNTESLTPIQIGVYDDRLEVWNCGVLPEGWTINNLLGKHRSQPYNPDIVNVFFCAGEIEAWGGGIERIIATCKTDGYLAPEFQYDSGGLWTVFHFDKSHQKITEATQKEMAELTETQTAIVEYLKKHPQTTRKELAEKITNITEDGIKYNLARLQELGILQRIGGRKLGYWVFIDKIEPLK